MLPIDIMRMRKTGAAPSWQTVRTNPASLNDSQGWNGWTGRQTCIAATLTDLTSSQIRITVKAADASQLKIAKMYIGFRSGSTFDYTGTPTQVLFGGSGSVLISAGAVQVSDPVSFAYDGTSDLVIGVYHDATAGYRAGFAVDATRGTLWQKNADDAATVSPAGGSVGSTQDIIWLIEAFA